MQIIRIYRKEREIDAPIGFSHGMNFDADLAKHLDQAGVAITAGFHATKPLHQYLGIQSTARASLYF